MDIINYYDPGRLKGIEWAKGGACGCAPHLVRPKIFFLVIFISSVIHVVWLYRLIKIFL